MGQKQMFYKLFSYRFSVDFAAHISYHYLDSPGGPDDRVRNSLYGLGLPILQGAVSTILGVIGLMIAPSYIFVTFFKMVLLVISLGFLHGLFLLPVLLSIFGPGSCSSSSTTPTTSYLSDGESLPSKPESESKQSSEKNSPSLNFTGEEMRIPRPSTTLSSDTRSSATSTPHIVSVSAPATTKHDRSRKSRGRSREPPIHEMYHNNGYLSEEDSCHAWSAAHWSMPHNGGPGHNRIHRYMTGFPGGAPPPPSAPPSQFYPPYGHPADTRHSLPTSRHQSKDRKSKSKSDCKRKKSRN